MKIEAILIGTAECGDFWKIGDDVYRTATNSIQNIWANPSSARWECSWKHWLRYRDIYAWVIDVSA